MKLCAPLPDFDKRKRGTVCRTSILSIRKLFVRRMPYTNESRNLRQARPKNKVGVVDLPRKNALATPSMGFINNNDYTITFCPCQAFFSISFDSERTKLSTKTYDKTPYWLQDHLASVQRQVGKRSA